MVSALARLAEDPSRAALLFDVDGVLAPIVARPEDACVPAATRAELRRLNGRYALVACISGRAGETAKQIVGVPELTYVGNHGLELEPESAEWRDALRRLLADADWPHTEDKGLTAALHYRDASDEVAAHAQLEAVAERARAAGFIARFGRKVLDVVPPLDTHKGTAVRRLLGDHGLQRALYAGDDTTDLDAFDALADMELGVRVAVASTEGPPELRARADVVIEQAEVTSLLQQL
jgi:trehalose 6-phosphate phosphatase